MREKDKKARSGRERNIKRDIGAGERDRRERKR